MPNQELLAAPFERICFKREVIFPNENFNQDRDVAIYRTFRRSPGNVHKVGNFIPAH